MSFRIAHWSAVSIIAIVVLVASLPALAMERPDAWITTKVKIALLTTEGVSGTEINVDTTNGLVTVHGTVGSKSEKAEASRAAGGIEGVREVRNLLQVVPEAKKESMKVSDDQLKTRVTAALESDETLQGDEIRVKSVNAGIVLLEGDARTLSDHRRAIEVAAGVKGTKRVESSIDSPDELADGEIWRKGGDDQAKAKGSTAGDMWITSAAKVRLMADSDTPALDINVDTSDGVVTLFGTVPSERSKRTAADLVRKVNGVQSVNNELQIVAAKNADRVEEKDDVIRSAIEDRLEARSDLDDSDIEVAVSNGVARLTGTVNSQSDRMTALTVTRATSGVRSVLDEFELAALPAVSSR